MTLRITPEPADRRAILRLEGRLGKAEVAELERCAGEELTAIDLGGLISADPDGLAALRRLRDRGVEVRNASRYLSMLLD